MVASATRIDANIVAASQQLDTPVMVVDRAIMGRNIAEMQSVADAFGVALRPHIKTHKTPRIAKLQIDAGAVGVTCAKLGEAEVMVDGDVSDIVIGYPTIGEIKIRRLIALMERARIVVAIDSREAGRMISNAMAAEERVLEIYVEVDTGQHRSGVLVGHEAVQLALDLERMPGIRVIGVMSHEGHANSQPPDAIEGVAISAGEALVATAEAIRRHGIELPVVSVGSTPAASFTPSIPGVTEMRPGTYVFKDTTAFRYGVFGPDRCACRVVATVVSHTAPDRCIVDAGSKTLALDKSLGHSGHGYIVGHPTSLIHALSEEHGWVSIGEGGSDFAIGERVEIIPNHVCPAVNLHDELQIVSHGHIVDTWAVAARGRVR